jgi:hypothetical protein
LLAGLDYLCIIVRDHSEFADTHTGRWGIIDDRPASVVARTFSMAYIVSTYRFSIQCVLQSTSLCVRDRTQNWSNPRSCDLDTQINCDQRIHRTRSKGTRTGTTASSSILTNCFLQPTSSSSAIFGLDLLSSASVLCNRLPPRIDRMRDECETGHTLLWWTLSDRMPQRRFHQPNPFLLIQ